MTHRRWRGLLCLWALLGSLQAAAQTPNGKATEPPAYGARDDVMRFADELAARHGELDARWLRERLQRARFVGSVQKLIMPPPTVNGRATVKDWAAYRARFVERDRIYSGVRFHDLVWHHAPEASFLSFRVTAERRDGGAPVNALGLERYTFRDGRIAIKDAYWKHIGVE